MEDTITFIHAADLHLGAPMRGFGNLPGAWAARLQGAIAEAYDRLVDAAIENDVDFVVIAGDVFDTSGVSYGDYLHFFEGMRKLADAGIPAYLTTGNHDPYSTWKDDVSLLPPSCRMLGGETPEYALFERGGEPLCLIAARGYRNQAWPLDEPIWRDVDRPHAQAALEGCHPNAARAPFCIGIIHTGLDLDQSKAYSDPQALMRADVDYWACGHLHKSFALTRKGCPSIVFPGCIQGRDLKESGERGFYLVTLSRESAGERDGASRERDGASPASTVQASLEFRPSASVVFATVEADVSACKTLADVAHLVQARLFHVNGESSCDEMVERVVLAGETDLHDYLRRPEVLRDLRKRINDAYPSFYCDTLVDHTRPLRDRASIEREGLFEAQALRIAKEQRLSPDLMINYVQAEFVKRGIDVPSSLARRIDVFAESAETLVLDLLGDDSA